MAQQKIISLQKGGKKKNTTLRSTEKKSHTQPKGYEPTRANFEWILKRWRQFEGEISLDIIRPSNTIEFSASALQVRLKLCLLYIIGVSVSSVSRLRNIGVELRTIPLLLLMIYVVASCVFL